MAVLLAGNISNMKLISTNCKCTEKGQLCKHVVMHLITGGYNPNALNLFNMFIKYEEYLHLNQFLGEQKILKLESRNLKPHDLAQSRSSRLSGVNLSPISSHTKHSI